MTPLQQFVDEARVTAETVLSWLGPQTIMEVGVSIVARAPALIDEAANGGEDDDDRLRAESVMSILMAIHGARPVPDEWWTTPLGEVCATSFGFDPMRVTWSVAASMLHVHPGTIAQMMTRGNTLLERHPDGGIVRGSVMREIVRRAELRDDR